MSLADGFLIVFPAALLLFGAFKLYFGARAFSIVQKIENTPTSKASSAAIGLVELSGHAAGAAGLQAPLSGAGCVFWKVYVRQHDPYHWKSKIIASASSTIQFSLKDDSGSVGIDSGRADVDLRSGPTHTSFLYSNSPENPKTDAAEPIMHASKNAGSALRESIEGAISGGSVIGKGTHHIPDKRVAAFIQANPAIEAAMERHSRRNLSMTEYAIKEGDAIFALGSLTGSPKHLLGKGKEAGILLISDEAEAQLVKDMRQDAIFALAAGAILLPLSLAIIYFIADSLV
ncbi:hypothetical protein L0Y65_04750 [Candidatus Micrarchaeota archaeon]|nr:hypothetical protein [Candidatus Micrarchaeota archaeon]